MQLKNRSQTKWRSFVILSICVPLLGMNSSQFIAEYWQTIQESFERYNAGEGIYEFDSFNRFSLQDLKQIVENEKPGSIAELLTFLPLNFKKSQIRVYHSRSLHCATGGDISEKVRNEVFDVEKSLGEKTSLEKDKKQLAAPRIILFNGLGSLFCSYNSGKILDYSGNESHCKESLNHFECIAQDEMGRLQSETFVFGTDPKIEIGEEFPANSDPVETDLDLEGESQAVTKYPTAVQYSGLDRCNSCHQGDGVDGGSNGLAILFDQYFLWPGMEGAINDNEGAKHKAPLVEKEYKKNFLEARSSNLRYFNTPIEVGGRRINLQFQKLQSFNNNFRIVRILESLEDTEKYFPLMRALLYAAPYQALKSNRSCWNSDEFQAADFFGADRFFSEVKGFFPEADHLKVLRLTKKLWRDTFEAPADHLDSALEFLKRTYGEKIEERNYKLRTGEHRRIAGMHSIGQLKYLVILRLLFELQEFDSDQLSGNYDRSFFFHNGQESEFYSTFNGYLKRRVKKFDDLNLDCEKLKKLSRKSLM